MLRSSSDSRLASRFRFTHSSLRPIGQMLARCRKLSHLDLSINPLMAPSADKSDSGAMHLSPFTALARSLEICQLAVLDLSCTGMSDTDVAALLDGAALSHISKLYLRSNALGDATAIALAERLPTSRLQVLSLAGNRVTNRGLGALAFALETSSPSVSGLSTPSTLETLDLDANQVRSLSHCACVWLGRLRRQCRSASSPPTLRLDRRARDRNALPCARRLDIAIPAAVPPS